MADSNAPAAALDITRESHKLKRGLTLARGLGIAL